MSRTPFDPSISDMLQAIRRKKPSWKPTKHILLLPLEPMEERYTAQWYQWFPTQFRLMGLDLSIATDTGVYDYETMPLPENRSVGTGTVLDATGTIRWKMQQMVHISRYLEEFKGKDLTVFTMDIQHPGIEAVKYMCHLRGILVRVYGYLHASSYTTEDFTAGMTNWLMPFEYAWINLCEKVFVGSVYHRDKVTKWRQRSPWEWMDRFAVVRAPFLNVFPLSEYGDSGWKEPNTGPRPIDVIWPHRFDREKRPNAALDIFEDILKHRPGARLAICTSRRQLGQGDPGTPRVPNFLTNDPTSLARFQRLVADGVVEFHYCRTKQEYYNLLGKAKIMLSTTIEENFGYCFVEAVANGVYPVVPNDFSHPEFFRDEEEAGHEPHGHLYADGQDAVKHILSRLDNASHVPGDVVRESWKTLLYHCQHSIRYMALEMFPGLSLEGTGAEEDEEF